MSERIENIRKAVEKHAGRRAEHRESVPVTEGYLDQIMWEGVVEVFDLRFDLGMSNPATDQPSAKSSSSN